MKKFISLLFSAALLMSGCSINEIPSGSDVFVASIEQMPDSKTYVDSDLTMHWNAGDCISVFKSSTNEKYVFDGEDGDVGGQFSISGSGLTGGDGQLDAVYAVYPYNPTTSISDDGEISLSFPAVQQYTVGSFGPGENTMVAVTADSRDNSLQFKNLCGFLVLRVYGDMTVKSISIKGNDGEMIAGPAAVYPSYGESPAVSMKDDATGTVTVDCGSGISLGSDLDSATSFWFCIPPVNFSHGMTFTFAVAGGESIEVSTTMPRTILRNVVYSMSAVRLSSGEGTLAGDGEAYGGQQDSGNEVVLSEQEETISLFPSGEDGCPYTEYTDEHLLQMDSIACHLLELNGIETRASELKTNINNLSGYIVEQIVWDAGDWGASHWAGDKITCYFDAEYNRAAEKNITVVLYREKGFQEGSAYLRLGTLNSGPVACSVPVSAGQKRITMDLNIDNAVVYDVKGNVKHAHLLPGYGILNLFPLIMYSNGYREYVNQVSIKSDPIVPSDWDAKDHSVGYLFGTVNGVEVRHNGNSVSKRTGNMLYNISGRDYQCVDLCSRYLTAMYSLNRSSKWGNANQWPDNRRNDTMDTYLVLDNDGSNRVREGDMIVFQYDDLETYPNGHIGVVIKTVNSGSSNYVSFAHQNGGNSSAQRPIGTTIKRSGDWVTKPGSRATTHFIRKDNKYEYPSSVQYEEFVDDSAPMFTVDVTSLEFGTLDIGEHLTKRFTISNEGTAPLIISSISVPDGYKCKYSTATVAPGESLSVPVRFDASEEKSYDGICRIETNAGNQRLRLYASGVRKKEALISLSTTTLNFNEVEINKSKTRYVTVTNSGEADLTVSSVSLRYDDDFSANEPPFTLSPGKSRDIGVTFSPKIPEPLEDVLFISSNASNCTEGLASTVLVKGVGIPEKLPKMNIRGSWLDFDRVPVGASATQTFTVENTGEADLVVSSASSPSGTAFSASLTTFTLSPGSSRSFDVTFTPKSSGTFEDSIVFTSNAYNGYDGYTQAVYLRGIGQSLSYNTSTVDLGLSVLWATCNLGASSPEEYGWYWAWGETAAKSVFNWQTYKWCRGSESTLTKYCWDPAYGYNGYTDGKKELEASDDAAYAHLGGSFRTPTAANWLELLENTDQTYTTNYKGTGVSGYIFTSKVSGYTNKQIFIPNAGYYNYLYDVGLYMTATLCDSFPKSYEDVYWDADSIWGVEYNSTVSISFRYEGSSVRPVKLK